jgi:dihydroorotase
MSDVSNIPEAARLMAEQQGLAKALKLYPEGVKAAAERGLKPLGALPKGITSISSPAPVFNPARFERDA